MASKDVFETGPRALLASRWSSTVSEWTVDKFFTRFIGQWPANLGLKPAVRQHSRTISFLALEREANAWMNIFLEHLDGDPLHRIAVAMKPCLRHPGLLLGILRAGAAYVPISSGWSQSFTTKVLEYIRPSILVTDDVERYVWLCGDGTRMLDVNSEIAQEYDDSRSMLLTKNISNRRNRSPVSPAIIVIKNLKKITHFSHAELLAKISAQWQIFPVWDEEIGIAKSGDISSTESVFEILGTLLSGQCLSLQPNMATENLEGFMDVICDLPVRRLWCHPEDLFRLCSSLDGDNLMYSGGELQVVFITEPQIPIDCALLFFRIFPDVKLAVLKTNSNGNYHKTRSKDGHFWSVYENETDILRSLYDCMIPTSVVLRDCSLALSQARVLSLRIDTSGGIYIYGNYAASEHGPSETKTNQPNKKSLPNSFSSFILSKGSLGWTYYDEIGLIDFQQFLNVFVDGTKLTLAGRKENGTGKDLPLYFVEQFCEAAEDEVVEFLIKNTVVTHPEVPVRVQTLADYSKALLRGSRPEELTFFVRDSRHKIVGVSVSYDYGLVNMEFHSLTNPSAARDQVISWTLFPLIQQYLASGKKDIQKIIDPPAPLLAWVVSQPAVASRTGRRCTGGFYGQATKRDNPFAYLRERKFAHKLQILTIQP